MLANCDVGRRFLSPLDCKEIKPVNPKGNQSWTFTGSTDAKVEAPVLWPPDTKNWLIGKDLDAGKDWRLEEERMTEDEKVRWHHWLNGREFEQALGVGDGQEGLVFCSPWGCRVGHDWAIELNWQHKLIQYCKAITLQLKNFFKWMFWAKNKKTLMGRKVSSPLLSCLLIYQMSVSPLAHFLSLPFPSPRNLWPEEVQITWISFLYSRTKIFLAFHHSKREF